MSYELSNSIDVLKRTPKVLRSLLGGLDVFWTRSGNDPEDWQPYDVVGHLIHAEKTDWIPRARIILDPHGDKRFLPFDRLAQFDASQGKNLESLLTEFEQLREESLTTMTNWELTEEQLGLQGLHPELGDVDLRQLISTWVVHDLTHVRQICVKMAERYREDVGPWRDYLSILR